jgi:hypothetical protein
VDRRRTARAPRLFAAVGAAVSLVACSAIVGFRELPGLGGDAGSGSIQGSGSSGASARATSGSVGSGSTESGATSAGAISGSDAGLSSDASAGESETSGLPSDSGPDSPQTVTLVPAMTGCLSMRIVYDDSSIFWSDMGHGTIASVAIPSGVVTTIASNQRIAAVQTNTGPLEWPVGPVVTALLVHGGTAYWIGASASGGVGTMVMSASAGNTPKTLLTVPMDPPASPVAVANGLEAQGETPPISAIALSPDASTIYFAAGTRFYSIPSSGGGPVTYVGYTSGPEHGEATTLIADSNYLYYLTSLSGNVEILGLGVMCDADAAAQGRCPSSAAESQGDLVYDTIVVKGTSLYWGNNSAVLRGDVTAAVAGNLSADNFSATASQTDLTGFAIGVQNAYFGEPGPDDAGYVEKGAAPPAVDATPSPAIVIARDQPNPMSFALDGTNVYWTTSRCDINYVADMPQ